MSTHLPGISSGCPRRADGGQGARDLLKHQQTSQGIAHDFNSVLATIIGGTELLIERIGDDPRTLGELEEIRGVAQRAATLTRELLAFSRQQVMRVDVTSLDRVVGRTETMLAPILEPDVEVRTHVGDATWPVRVDEGQMEQVLVNLAVNAQDAMPEGGVFTMATSNRTLESDTRVAGVLVPAGDYVELTLDDTGIGMDEMTRTRVFEPFFTTKPPPEGTGLGLSVAYGIIRQFGGFMSVASAPGEGATFRILLPRADEEAAAWEDEVRAEPAPRVRSDESRRTVLFVEDEDALRRIGSRVLERLDFDVLSAAGRAEALALLEASTPALDLLVTDVVMPGMDGTEVAAAVSDLYPRVPVLFISGYSVEAGGRLGTLGPGRAFLQKPYSIESIAESVRALLAER
ncbi:MAG TPA: ATP-binding protein [Longimicrobiales bacterium]|nr:ATP-binding protein [Longimicrobiales bacterium]